MDILLWLAPAAVVTVAAMLWVGWRGSARREGRGEIDRETAARKMGEALSREGRRRPGYAVPPRAPEPSTGVAVRRTRPVVVAGTDDSGPTEGPDATAHDRRAS